MCHRTSPSRVIFEIMNTAQPCAHARTWCSGVFPLRFLFRRTVIVYASTTFVFYNLPLIPFMLDKVLAVVILHRTGYVRSKRRPAHRNP